MLPERKGTTEPQPRPPKWWHEVIRNNFVGSLVSPDRFETIEDISSDGIPYIIHSFTEGAEKEGFPEGIFVTILVPSSENYHAEEFFLPILGKLKKAFSDDLVSKLGPGEGKDDIDENPEYLGAITKIDRKTALAISPMIKMEDAFNEDTRIHFSKFAISVAFASHEVIVGQVKTKFENYFSPGMTRLDRVLILEHHLMNNILKKAVLEREFSLIDAELMDFKKRAHITDRDLESLRRDAEVQKIYTGLLDLARRVSNPSQRMILNTTYRGFEPLIQAGFLDFYKKYWQDQLSKKPSPWKRF